MISGKKRSEKEYRKLDILSASDLRKYATKDRRTFFKECILRQKSDDENSRATKIGSAAHSLLLEPEEFDNKFFMSICMEPPTGKMRAFVDALFKHTVLNSDENGAVTTDFSELAELAYTDSGYKRDKLEAVLLNFKNKEPEMYYRERRACEISGKELICQEDRNIAEKVVETIKNHEYTSHLFRNSKKEVQIDDFEINGLPMKAMIDDIEESSAVTISDLKVTWTNEDFFNEHFIKRRADIQAFVYKKAAEKRYPGFKINPFRFVVADSTNFCAPLIYTVGEDWEEKTMNGFTYNDRYYKGVNQIIEEIKWHTSTGNWSVSQEAFNSLGNIKI